MQLTKKEQMYKLLVEKLFDRCQKIQAENERAVMRANGLKKILRRRTLDLEVLKRRLDRHGDDWRTMPMVAAHPKGKVDKKRGPKPKTKPQAPGGEPSAAKPGRKPRKQRAKKQQPADNGPQQLHQLQPQQQQTQQMLTV